MEETNNNYICECGSVIKMNSRYLHFFSKKHKHYCMMNGLDLPIKQGGKKGRPRTYNEEEAIQRKKDRALSYYNKNKEAINKRRFTKHVCEDCGFEYTSDKRTHHNRTQRHIKAVELKNYLKNKEA